MKILYVLNDTLKYGGTEAVCLNYLHHINKEIYTIDFLLHTTEDEMNSNEICSRLRQQGINIYCVTPRRISVNKNIKELNSFFKNHKYDIIHSHADSANYIILKIAKNNGHRHLISHCHSTGVMIKNSRLKEIIHSICLKCFRMMMGTITKNYMACSYEAGKWMFGKRNVDSGKVYILKNAIDLKKFCYNKELRDRIRKKLNIEDAIVIGHVGRFTFEKNHEFIIKLFKKLQDVSDKFKLLLIGTGELYNNIVDEVNRCGLNDKVVFIGNTNEVNMYYNAMDYFILPSIFEGLSLVLVEAQANGLQCLASNTVPEDARVVPSLVEYKSLNDMDDWVNFISNNLNYDRFIDYSDEITKKGYNIYVETKKLEKYYDELACK